MTRRQAPPAFRALGVILAGGRSQRFGEDKSRVTLGGMSLVRRAAHALAPATDRVVLVANEAQRHATEGLEIRPDLRPGVGALGGVHTAVAWAAEAGAAGAVVLACDMPFVPPALVAGLVENLAADGIVVPASGGPRGFEPLCAAYGVDCLHAIEEAIDRGERTVVSFFIDVPVHVLASAEVAAYGDPNTMFFNVNRPEDRSRAEALLAEGHGTTGPSTGETGS